MARRSRRAAPAPTERKVKITTESELAVLGAALTDPASRRRACACVRAEDFLDDQNRALWRAAERMCEDDLSYHEDTVAALAGPRAEWGGYEKLRAVVKEYGQPLADVDFHAQRMRFAVLRRDLTRGVQEDLVELAGRYDAGPEDVIAFAERLGARATSLLALTPSDAPRVIGQTRAHLRAVAEGRQRFVSAECEVLDGLLTQGYVPGKCSVLGGRPGTGKTQYAVRLMGRRAENGRGTCYISCEAEEHEIGCMLAARALRLPYTTLIKHPASLADADRKRVKAYLDAFEVEGLFEVIADAHLRPQRRKPDERWYPGDANERALDRLEAIVSRTPHKLVVVDLIGYFIPEAKFDLIDAALLRVKAMARRHGVHILLLHHLKRADPRAPKAARPTMDDFRASGGFEQSLDNVMAIHRPRRGKRSLEQGKGDVLELHCFKQRGGGEFVVTYDFLGQFADVENPRVAPSSAAYDSGKNELEDI